MENPVDSHPEHKSPAPGAMQVDLHRMELRFDDTRIVDMAAVQRLLLKCALADVAEQKFSTAKFQISSQKN